MLLLSFAFSLQLRIALPLGGQILAFRTRNPKSRA